MTRKEFLEQTYLDSWAKRVPKVLTFYQNPASAYIAPFQIADNLYYVGDKKVCIHLLDTGDGLILFDAGYYCTEALLIESIWCAGFDPKDVKWIIHTHAHFDHYGASVLFRNLYGTKLAISRVDAEHFAEMPSRGHTDHSSLRYGQDPEDFDRLLEDGEIFELGNAKIRCVLTPGHTVGVLTFFFDVTWEGKTYLAGLFGGAGTNSMGLVYATHNEEAPDMTDRMLESIDKVWDEPVVVHLGNHPYNNKTLQKRAKQLEEGGNPFIDPDSWHRFLAELREDTQAVAEKNKEMSAALDVLFGKE